MSYTLKQATEFMVENKDNLQSLSSNPELLEYVDNIQDVGKETLLSIGKESLEGASILTILLMEGNIKGMMLLMSDTDTFNTIVSAAMKMSVGMAITEEWR